MFNRFRVLCLAAAAAMISLASIQSAASTSDKKDVTIALFVAIQANPVEQAIINAFHRIAEQDGAARFVVFDSDRKSVV